MDISDKIGAFLEFDQLDPSGGRWRVVAPDETLARASKIMSKCGITRVANVTGLDRIGIPVVMVIRPNARSVSVSAGKGENLTAAKASGVMEAVETWHAENILSPLRLARYADLAKIAPCADPSTLPQDRNSKFDPSAKLLWIEGLDLFTGDNIWVPYELASVDWTIPGIPGAGSFSATTNGLASGNVMTEAVLHGIYEVVERDSHAIWNEATTVEQKASYIDLNTVKHPVIGSLLKQTQTSGFKIHAWDITSDIGLPSFQVVLLDQNNPRGHFGAGHGCHGVPEIALTRALIEAAQVRLTYVSGARDDIGRREYNEVVRQDVEKVLAKAVPSETSGGDFAACQSRTGETIADDLVVGLERLRNVGLSQAICVDLRHEEIGIPVVRMILPGLNPPPSQNTLHATSRVREGYV